MAGLTGKNQNVTGYTIGIVTGITALTVLLLAGRAGTGCAYS